MKRPHGFGSADHDPSHSLLHQRRRAGTETDTDGTGAAPDGTASRSETLAEAGAEAEHGTARQAAQSQPEAPVALVERRENAGEDEASADDAPSLRAARRARRKHERGEIKRFTRQARRRRRAWLISVGSVVGVVAALVLVALSPLMALRTISVEGAHRVDAAALTQSLSSQLGTPLALINYQSVRNEVARYPLVRSYTTQVRPPGTLVVRIVERTPVGVVAAHGGFDLVDQAGVVISQSARRPAGYPLIALEGAPGSAEAHRSFASSAAVLAALPPATRAQAESITASTADDVTITLAGGVKVVWGGPAQSDLKAADLAALLKSVPGASLYDVSAPDSPVTG